MYFHFKQGKFETKIVSSPFSCIVAFGSAPHAVLEGPVVISIPDYQLTVAEVQNLLYMLWIAAHIEPFVSDEERMFRSRRKMFRDGKKSNIYFH